MTHHLGYERDDPAGHGSGNPCNGSTTCAVSAGGTGRRRRPAARARVWVQGRSPIRWQIVRGVPAVAPAQLSASVDTVVGRALRVR